jgi:hypothetical protein
VRSRFLDALDDLETPDDDLRERDENDNARPAEEGDPHDRPDNVVHK